MKGKVGAIEKRRVFSEVVLPLLRIRFTYEVPTFLQGKVKRGCRVVVPLRGRDAVGVVWKFHDCAPEYGVKAVTSCLDDGRPLWNERQLRFLDWVVSYYVCEVPALVKVALGPLMRLFKLDEEGEIRRLKEEPVGVLSCRLHLSLAKKGLSEITTLCGGRRQRGCLEAYWHLCDGDGALWGSLRALAKRGYGGDVVRRMTKRGIFSLEEVCGDVCEGPLPLAALSEEQQAGCDAIAAIWEEKGTAVLWGRGALRRLVDGWAVFFRPLPLGKQVVALLPNELLYGLWKERLANDHRGVGWYDPWMSAVQRERFWSKVASGRIRWIIGCPSVLMVPFQSLERVVVIGESNGDYRPKEGVPFHGRDGAIMLAHQHGGRCLLVSRVVSLESYRNIKRGLFGSLYKEGDRLPVETLRVVRGTKQHTKKRGLLEDSFRERIKEALSEGRKVVVVASHGGYALHGCDECGWSALCSSCGRWLVYHQVDGKLNCRYCGLSKSPHRDCPGCGAEGLVQWGVGVERWAELVRFCFGEKGVVVMNRGGGWRTQRKELRAFLGEGGRILVGTPRLIPWLAKEGSFLVVIPDADSWLRFPDFRAEERAYGWLADLVGKEDNPHEVWLGGYERGGGALRELVRRLWQGKDDLVCDKLLQERAAFGYPPTKCLIGVIVYHKRWQRAFDGAILVGEQLAKVAGTDVPAPHPIVKQYRGALCRVGVWCRVDRKAAPKVKVGLRKELEGLKKNRHLRGVSMRVEMDGNY